MTNLALQLAQITHLVDSAAFPEKPLEVFLVPQAPLCGRPQFGFGYNKDDPEKSFYFIHSIGLEQYFQEGREFCIHIMLEHEALRRAYQKGVIYYTKEETLLAVSVHEVRHRLQFLAKVPLFEARHTGQVSRCRYWTEKQAAHYKNDPNGAYEFDAKFFEQYGAQEFRQGRLKLTTEDLRSLLHMTAEQFLERESRL